MAKGSFGTDVWVGGIQIDEVYDVRMPQGERETIDTTHHGLPNKFRTHINGLIDAGEGEIDFAATQDNMDELIPKFESDALQPIIVYTDESPMMRVCTFQASITKCPYAWNESPVDGKYEGTISFKVSGKPTITYTTNV